MTLSATQDLMTPKIKKLGGTLTVRFKENMTKSLKSETMSKKLSIASREIWPHGRKTIPSPAPKHSPTSKTGKASYPLPTLTTSFPRLNQQEKKPHAYAAEQVASVQQLPHSIPKLIQQRKKLLPGRHLLTRWKISRATMTAMARTTRVSMISMSSNLKISTLLSKQLKLIMIQQHLTSTPRKKHMTIKLKKWLQNKANLTLQS